jgi:hypothetical protein
MLVLAERRDPPRGWLMAWRECAELGTRHFLDQYHFLWGGIEVFLGLALLEAIRHLFQLYNIWKVKVQRYSRGKWLY